MEGGGGNCVGVCETLTLSQTKICDFPYLISDLFQLLHGWLNNLRRASSMVLSPNDEEDASSKKHTQFKTQV